MSCRDWAPSSWSWIMICAIADDAEQPGAQASRAAWPFYASPKTTLAVLRREWLRDGRAGRP